MSTTRSDLGLHRRAARLRARRSATSAERELGTREQRERLTNGYTELHNQEIYEKLAELGWLGVVDPRGVRRRRRRHGRRLHLPRGDDARPGPDRRLRRQR